MITMIATIRLAGGATAAMTRPARLVPVAQVTPEGALPERLRAIGDHWGDSMIPAGWVIGAGSVLLATFAVLWLWTWWRQRHLQPQPWSVFNRTARHMGLTWREQWLLIRIARHEQLPSPLTLMLSRRTLGHHTKHYIEDLSPRRRAAVVRRVMAIRQALFEPSAPAPAPGITPGMAGRA